MSEQNQPVWLQLQAEDLEGTNFEAPLVGCSSVSSHSLGSKYRDAIEKLPEGGNAPSRRVYRVLQELLFMHFNAANVFEPYQPMVTFSDGSRSAIPRDFFEKKELLWSIATAASHPALRARISDISWILNRKHSDAARAAVAGYCDLIDKVREGVMFFGEIAEVPHLSFETSDLITRALHIGRALGVDKDEFKRAANLSKLLFDDAIEENLPIPACRFGQVALNFQTVNRLKIGRALAAIATSNEADIHASVHAYKLAAQSFKRAGENALADEQKMLAARLLEAHANNVNHPLVSTHFIEDAISILSTTGSAKEYKTKLKKRLLEFQADIADHMDTISSPLHISDLVKDTKESFDDLPITVALFRFADLDKSPNPEELKVAAEQSLRDFPLSAMFSTVHLDREGKTIKRVDAGDGSDDKICEKIWQLEKIRRQLVVSAKIEPARQIINFEHAQLSEALVQLAGISPFIPKHLSFTMATGFSRFFSGDFVSALYILTPNLEAIVRHVLRLNGYDTTSLKEGNLEQVEKNLGDICENMSAEIASIITKPMLAEIMRLFLSRPGPALRHEVAHGLTADDTPFSPDSIYGCWFIFRLCLLPLFPHFSHVQEQLMQLKIDRSA